MTGKYTAHQLAMELGVSDSTVSRALSGKGRIGDERSREIVKIARERGLIPSSAVQKRTGNIGIVLPVDAWDGAAFFLECMEGIVNSLVLGGYDILLCMAAENDIKPVKRLVESKKADAYIMLRALEEDKQIKYLSSIGNPCVLIGSCDMDVAQIDSNHISSGRDLTMYLLAHGLKNIVYLGGKSTYVVNQARLRGYFEAYERLGMTCNRKMVFQDVITTGQIQYIVEEFRVKQVDCVLCGDDLICSRVLQVLMLNGLRVPEDMAVASLNNSSFLDHYTPQITAVEISAKDLGTAAGQQIVKMLKGKENNSRHLLSYNLLLRGSTRGK